MRSPTPVLALCACLLLLACGGEPEPISEATYAKIIDLTAAHLETEATRIGKTTYATRADLEADLATLSPSGSKAFVGRILEEVGASAEEVAAFVVANPEAAKRHAARLQGRVEGLDKLIAPARQRLEESAGGVR